jgi:hypothetical protein
MGKENTPRPFASSKYLRQLASHLALCGLSHWREVLIQFLERYAGLERVVDDDREGPQAAVIHLLRDLSANDLRPSDREFSSFIAELAFLSYRVRRARPTFTFETADLWQPLQHPMSTWKLGHDIGAWRSLKPPVPRLVIAQELLHHVHLVQSEHCVRH